MTREPIIQPVRRHKALVAAVPALDFDGVAAQELLQAQVIAGTEDGTLVGMLTPPARRALPLG